MKIKLNKIAGSYIAHFVFLLSECFFKYDSTSRKAQLFHFQIKNKKSPSAATFKKQELLIFLSSL
jgi:hypothetical protein